MSCDENSFKHNKQTSSSEVRTKTASFMHQSSNLVAWINDGRPSFLLWLRLRRFVVFGEGIWGCSRWNSALDFFWVAKLPRLHDGQLWRKIQFNGTLYEFKGFQPVSISVSFCDLDVELYTQDLVKFLRRRLFQDIYFQDGGIGTSISTRGRSFIRCFVERIERLRIFIHSDRVKVLYCFVWSYRKPGNIYLF